MFESYRAGFEAELDGIRDAGTYMDKVYEINLGRVIYSGIYYNKDLFTEFGVEVPTTWDELLELSDTIVSDGDAPWCVGIESGAATGWVATDWTEEMMLRTTTPENYDAWVAGDLPFSSPEVKNAAETLAEIWFNDDYVYGGRASIVTTFFGDAPTPMFEDPPKCWLHKQGNFITSFFPEGVQAGTDYGFFYFPPVDEAKLQVGDAERAGMLMEDSKVSLEDAHQQLHRSLQADAHPGAGAGAAHTSIRGRPSLGSVVPSLTSSRSSCPVRSARRARAASSPEPRKVGMDRISPRRTSPRSPSRKRARVRLSAYGDSSESLEPPSIARIR